MSMSLENVGASRLPQGEGTRYILLVLQMTATDYKLDHQDRSWVISNSFLPLEKQLKALSVLNLEHNSGFLAALEVSRKECSEGGQENFFLKICSFYLSFRSVQNSVIRNLMLLDLEIFRCHCSKEYFLKMFLCPEQILCKLILYGKCPSLTVSFQKNCRNRSLAKCLEGGKEEQEVVEKNQEENHAEII